MNTIEAYNSKLEKVKIQLDDIIEFGIINVPTSTIKNTFKSWSKTGYIYTHDNTRYKLHYSYIKELKDAFMGKIATEKVTHTAYKKWEERKATDWHYRIIGRECRK